MRIVRALALAACAGAGVLALATACGSFEADVPPSDGGVDGATETGPSDEASASEGGGDGGVSCPTKGGAMARVQPFNSKPFCVDVTEVTNAAYKTFLVETQRNWQFFLACGFKNGKLTFDEGAGCNPTENPTRPVVCVDFCDAYAFCKWAGKRLCGDIDGGPTPVNTGELNFNDQHYAACTAGDITQKNPYPGQYKPGACNDGLHSGRAMMPVGNLKDCVTDSGLFDMVGNASEWVDSCFDNGGGGNTSDGSAGGENDGCQIHGGSWAEPSDAGAFCSTKFDYQPRRATRIDLGFRCCADLP